MQKYKSILASIAAAGLVLSTALQSAVYWATGFDDPEFDQALNWMHESGLTQYNTVDSFRPFDNLTREQAAHFFANFAETTLGMEADSSVEVNLNDLDEADHTLVDSIEAAYRMGIMRGSEGEFRPTDQVTRAEFLTVAVRALDGDRDETATPWWTEYFETARELGLTQETDVNAQDRSILRYEAGLMLSRAAGETGVDHDDDDVDLSDLLEDLLGDDEDEEDHEDHEDEEDYVDHEDEEDEADYDVEDGDLEVALNPNSPSDQSIPRSGYIEFAKLDLAAGDADVQVDSITLNRDGLGSRSDIRRVWFELDNQRVSSRQSLTRDNVSEVRFDRGFTVSADEVKTLTLVVELDETTESGNEHSFSINSADDIDATANVMGNFPIQSGLMRTSGYEVAETEVRALDAGEEDREYNVGESNVMMWEIEIGNKGNNEEATHLSRMTVRQAGDANVAASLDNLGLYVDWNEVTSNVIVDGRDVTFVVDPDNNYSTREDGNIEVFEIRADVLGAEREEETYQFEIRRTSDVLVREVRTWFSSVVEFADNNTTIVWGEYTVRGGDVILSRDTSYSQSQTVSRGTSDVVLLSANISVDQPFIVEDGINIWFENEVDDGVLDKVFNTFRLTVDGSTVATYTPSDSSDRLDFDTSFTISDSTTIQILWDVRSNADVGDVDVFELERLKAGDSQIIREPRYISNDESVQIDGSVRGKRTTIGDAVLTLSKRDSLDATENVVAGASDVKVLWFRLRTNDVSDMRVSRIVFEDKGSQIDDSEIQNIRLYKGDTLLDTNSSGDFSFENLNVTIPKNDREEFNVVVDFGTNITDEPEHEPTFQLVLSAAWAFGDDWWNLRVRDLSSNRTFNYNNSEDENTFDWQIIWSTFEFVEEGQVEISRHSNSLSRSVLTPSNELKQVFKLEMEASDDNMTLEDLDLALTGDDQIDLSSSLRDAVLYVDGNEYYGFDTMSGDYQVLEFEDMDISLPADERVTMEVRMSFFDSSSAERFNKNLKLAVAKAVFVSDSTGLETVMEWYEDINVMSRNHLFARTAPVVSMGSNARGEQEVEITADENRSLEIEELKVRVTWDVNLTWANVNMLELYAWSDIITLDGDPTVEGDVITFDIEWSERVSAQETEIFEIRELWEIEEDDFDSMRLRVVGMKYTSGTGEDAITLDDDSNEYRNTGIPTSTATISD